MIVRVWALYDFFAVTVAVAHSSYQVPSPYVAPQHFSHHTSQRLAPAHRTSYQQVTSRTSYLPHPAPAHLTSHLILHRLTSHLTSSRKSAVGSAASSTPMFTRFRCVAGDEAVGDCVVKAR